MFFFMRQFFYSLIISDNEASRAGSFYAGFPFGSSHRLYVYDHNLLYNFPYMVLYLYPVLLAYGCIFGGAAEAVLVM